MKRDERTALNVLQELADTAAGRNYTDAIFRSPSKIYNKENAELVGKLVENLSDEDRDLLKGLKSTDVEEAFRVLLTRPRPERPIKRKRGPVTLSKGKKE